MGVYRYSHDWCGFDQDVYLEGEGREHIHVPCYRCGLVITAHLVRDKSAQIGRSVDGMIGIKRQGDADEEKKKDRERGS